MNTLKLRINKLAANYSENNCMRAAIPIYVERDRERASDGTGSDSEAAAAIHKGFLIFLSFKN